MRRKRVAVFGSTGSVGSATLQVIAHLADRLRLVAIAAHRSVGALRRQALRYHPEHLVVTDPARGEPLRRRLGKRFNVELGEEALIRLAGSGEFDILVMAMSGTAGLDATLAALKTKKTVALATKELLVSYGTLLIDAARKSKARVLPIDSELAALHQCLNGKDPGSVRRLILTASGGPFWRKGLPFDAPPEAVLRHPVWKMGKKITVDSATLMNKGLEVIETVRLFEVTPGQVTAVIHPESIVHALVEFEDGALLAQLASPDMRLPIQYCLTYPERLPSRVQPLALEQLRRLGFFPLEPRRFPCFALACRALSFGPTATCVLSAANEVAVHAFLNNKIAFGTIPVIINRTLNRHMKEKPPEKVNLELLRRVEKWATRYARALIEKPPRRWQPR